MKKLFICSLVIALMAGFTSCNDDDDDAPVLGANVKVTVENFLTLNQDNVTVYMFDKEVNDNTKKSDAKKSVVTNNNGVADFDINFTQLNILESQTTLYFAVFYTIGDEDYVAGSSGITVKRNESYNVTVRIPV